MDYQIVPEGYKYRVMADGKLTKGRYHTYTAAQEWISSRIMRANNYKAHIILGDHDYSQTNERLIRGVTL